MKSLYAAAFALALLAPAANAQPPAPARGGVEIVDSMFGLFATGADGQPSFHPSQVVPLKTGQAYGWVMKLRTDKPKVHYREEFTLPGAASNWGTAGSPETKVGADRKTAVSERDVPLADGVILNAWSVADGDPPGHYVIRVTVEDQPARQFDFDVK
jgi:hypothetical protein